MPVRAHAFSVPKDKAIRTGTKVILLLLACIMAGGVFSYSARERGLVGESPGRAAFPASSAAERAENGIVLVAALRDDGLSLGSGFFVNENTVLTNAHVIRGARKIRLGNSRLGWREATIRAKGRGEAEDYAALGVSGGGGSPIPLQKKAFRGEKVSAWGYPGVVAGAIDWQGGMPEPVRTSGEINVIPKTRPAIVVHDAMITPGVSGGPLLNPAGRAIGINTLVLDAGRTGKYSLAIGAESLMLFLRANGLDFTHSE